MPKKKLVHEPIDINIPPQHLTRFLGLTDPALNFLFDVLNGHIDATVKERLDVVKLILAKSLPDSLFTEALKRQLPPPPEQAPTQQPQRLGVSGYDPHYL